MSKAPRAIIALYSIIGTLVLIWAIKLLKLFVCRLCLAPSRQQHCSDSITTRKYNHLISSLTRFVDKIIHTSTLCSFLHFNFSHCTFCSFLIIFKLFLFCLSFVSSFLFYFVILILFWYSSWVSTRLRPITIENFYQCSSKGSDNSKGIISIFNTQAETKGSSGCISKPNSYLIAREFEKFRQTVRAWLGLFFCLRISGAETFLWALSKSAISYIKFRTILLNSWTLHGVVTLLFNRSRTLF